MLSRLLPLILFVTLPVRCAGAAQDIWTGIERIVAIGDIHADYRQFVALLKGAGLVDKDQKWIGGKTHLVQTGDVVDRGPDSRKVMDLLMRLERPAEKAGGRVHALIGNHEAMNIYGDLRYVSPQEYQAFRESDSNAIRERFYKQHVEELKKSSPPQGLPEFDDDYRKQWEAQHPLGFFRHRYAFGPNGKYGRWILRHNAVIKINDTLFLHGGISPKLAASSIQDINEEVLAELKDFSKLPSGLVMDPDGPLWYRGLAENTDSSLAAHVDALLKNYGCRRIVVGHTVTAGAVIPRFGGKVVLIDVGLSEVFGARLACLIIEKDRAYALHRGKKLELPADSGPPLVAYLKKAAALDPAPSPLKELINQTEAAAAVPAVR